MKNLCKLAAKSGIVLLGVLLVSILTANAQPNLTPYRPSGWSDKIVVARTGSSVTDSTGLTTLDTLYVDWAVINNGNSNAITPFYIYLYVDGTHTQTWTSPTLVPNGYVFVTNYSIGSLALGMHTITITADATGVVAESNESDNSYTKTIMVGAPSQPDLTRSTDNLSNFSPHPGDTVMVSLAITNESCTGGSTNAGAFHTGFYLSTNSSFTGATPFLEAAFAGCPSNSTVSTNQSLTINPATAGGTWYLGYKINDENEVVECNTSNNGFFYWTITVVSYADLTPQNVTESPNPVLASGSATVSYTVANVGGTAAPASHSRVQIRDSASNILVQQVFATAAIAANSSTNESHSLSLSGANNTTYYAYVTVDCNSEVNQGVNTNNDSSSGVAFSVLTQTGLVIIPTFDSSITSDPQAATIEATINSAIAVYEAAFADPVTANITFEEMGSGLGLSSSYYDTVAYTDYRAALVSHATTADDATALAHLPAGPNNPVNGNASVNLRLTLARALGFSANPPAGQPDGTVYLNTSIMNLSSSQNNSGKYSLFATVSHEMDEVLALGSALNGLANGAASPTGPVYPQDLYRYDQTGARSFDTGVNTTCYFSLDGTTDLVQYNQEQGGDFGDWYSYPFGAATPRVQDAFATPGVFPVLGVELRALDVMGFTYITPKTNQSINFAALPNRSFGEHPFAVGATASSGLPVSFNIVSGPATISTSNVTLTGTGAVTVRASQSGNTNYYPAPNVDQAFTVYSPPAINPVKVVTNLVMKWPTNVPGYFLQSTLSLKPVVVWTTLSNSPGIANGVYAYTNTATNKVIFYRLVK